jgi:hypothetical protein
MDGKLAPHRDCRFILKKTDHLIVVGVIIDPTRRYIELGRAVLVAGGAARVLHFLVTRSSASLVRA